MRKSVIMEMTVMALCLGGAINSHAQQPQTSAAVSSGVNAEYTQGVGPGYWPTAGAGLILNLSAGTVVCAGSVVDYAGGTLTMTASTTNYVYLNSSSSCVPASNTTGFTPGNDPIATVVTSGSVITSISDVRSMFTLSNAPPWSSLTNPIGTLTLAMGGLQSVFQYHRDSQAFLPVLLPL